jgi:MFS family permease
VTDHPEAQTNSVTFWNRTFSSLKYRNFRLVWLGSCTEHIGQQMETLASAWLMKELTQSPYYLGLLALCRVTPLFFFALVGGVVADRFDRRKLLLACFMVSAAVSLVLLILARTGAIAPWHLLVAGILSSGVIGFNHPARDALIPNLTPKHEWMNAIAMDTISVRTAAILSAPLAGSFIAAYGTAPLFGVRTLGMLLASWWLVKLKVPPAPASPGSQGIWDRLGSGLRYSLTSGLIVALLMVFALREFQQEMSMVFLPFFADNILRSGPQGYGYLNMAQGIGGVVGLFGIATLGNFKYKGWLISITGILMGLFLIGFSLSHVLILSVALLIVANGFGSAFENVARTAVQTIVPNEMRGRVMSMKEVVRGFFGTWVTYGLGLGGEYLGVVTASMFLGIFIILSVTLIVSLVPSFRKL